MANVKCIDSVDCVPAVASSSHIVAYLQFIDVDVE